MPTMLHASAGLMLWHMARGAKRPLKRLMKGMAPIVSGFLLIFVFSGLLYLPILIRNPVGNVSNHWYLARRPLVEVLRRSIQSLPELLLQWHGSLPTMVGLAMIALAFAGFALSPDRAKSPVALVFWGLAGAGILVLLQGAVPMVRVWIYLLPIYLCAVAYGISCMLGLARGVRPEILHRRSEICGLALVALLSLRLVQSGDVRESRETGTLQEANQISEYLYGGNGI